MKFAALVTLPVRVSKKIRLELPDASEEHSCWLWTGAFTKPRQGRMKARRVSENSQGTFASAYVRASDHGTAKIHCSELGYAVEAHRYIYGLLAAIPFAEVPRLMRCGNDRCVNPHHTRERGPVVRPAAQRDGRPTPLQMLQEVRPCPYLDMEASAEDAGIPPGAFTTADWVKYVKWAFEQPDDD